MGAKAEVELEEILVKLGISGSGTLEVLFRFLVTSSSSSSSSHASSSSPPEPVLVGAVGSGSSFSTN